MTVFIFWCNKGGVGKTTLTAYIAKILAKMGYNVLVVDADPQGCMEDSVYKVVSKTDKTLNDLLNDKSSIKDCICKTTDGFFVIIGDYDLNSVTLKFADKIKDFDTKVRTLIGTMDSLFDFVLIDINPSLDSVLANIMLGCANNRVLIGDIRGKKEYQGLFTSAYHLTETLGIKDYSVIVNNYGISDKSKILYQGILENFGDHLWSYPIPFDKDIMDSGIKGVLLDKMDNNFIITLEHNIKDYMLKKDKKYTVRKRRTGGRK